MTTSHFLLTLLFGAAFLAWLGVSGYVVVGRSVHDGRARRLARASKRASGRGLSPRALRHAAADPSVSRQAALAFAFEVAATIGTERIVAGAGSHRTESGKWRRIEMLRILALVDESRALAQLERALRADEDVASAAAVILGDLGSEAAARILAGGIADSQAPDSRLAAHLDSYPRDVAQVVRELAADASAARRYRGMSLLSRYVGRADVRQQLCAAAADVDPNVRAAVAEALGAAPRDGLEELDALVRDHTWFVRAHAARALAARRCPDLGAVVAPLLTDRNWWVRAAAKDALASLGADAVAVVAPYLNSSDGFARDGAVEVLERIGNVDAVLVEAAYLAEVERAALAPLQLVEPVEAAA